MRLKSPYALEQKLAYVILYTVKDDIIQIALQLIKIISFIYFEILVSVKESLELDN